MPVLGQNVLGMFVGWSDMILTGQILVEHKYLAAVVTAGYLLWLAECFSSLVSTGAQAIVSRQVGGKRFDEANEIVFQSLLMAILLGVLMMFLMRQFADALVGQMKLTGEASELAADYLRLVILSCPLMMIMDVGVVCLRAAGYTLAGMWIFTVVNLVNIVCSWALTVGIGPIPAMGWTGIATGTLISYVAGGLLTLVWLSRGEGVLKLPWHAPMLPLASVVRVLRIGIPGAANSLTVVLCQIWFLSIIARLGDAAVAAHGVAIRCESLSFLTAEAFAVAAATLVGQSLGAYRPDLARRYGWMAFRIGAIAMSAMGVIFYLFASSLFAIFVRADQASVLAQGIPVLRLVAFAMPALAATIILTGALRGAGDTRWPLLYNSAGLLLFRLPLAYALTGGWWLSLGLLGAWIAMLIDLYVRGSAAFLRFGSGSWSKINV